MLYWLMQSARDLDKPPEWFLSEAEQKQFAAFRFEKRRTDWLLGRWTAKRLLQAVVLEREGKLVLPDQLEIQNDQDGVPWARDVRDPARHSLQALHLSLSHSQGAALAAVSNLAVGADLELIEPRTPELFERYLTVAELQRVREAPPEVCDTLLTAIWSAKEAALKALHKGLSVDTRAVEIRLGPFAEPPAPWTPFGIATQLDGGTWLYGWWCVIGQFVVTLAGASASSPPAMSNLRLAR